MAESVDYKNAKSIYDFTVKDTFGNDVPLEKYKGKVCVIVNIASQCGLTSSNYAKLTDLKKKYENSGPCFILPAFIFNTNTIRIKRFIPFSSFSFQMWKFCPSHATNLQTKCPKKMEKKWYAIWRKPMLIWVLFSKRSMWMVKTQHLCTSSWKKNRVASSATASNGTSQSSWLTRMVSPSIASHPQHHQQASKRKSMNSSNNSFTFWSHTIFIWLC